MTKYFNKNQIEEIIGIITISNEFALMSQDSYNEQLIANKVKQTGKEGTQLLYYSSLNLAIVGFGNQKYGNFRIGDEIINIPKIFVKYGIKYGNTKNSLLKEDDLTPGRLCRFFRYQIKEYIQKSNYQSYLWRKYSDRNVKFGPICFRGAEYLDDLTEDESKYLLSTIQKMDAKLQSTVSERVQRVFEAKGKFLI